MSAAAATLQRFAWPAPRQITMALDARGLDGPGVDEACGVAEPVVDLWEAGVLLARPEQVDLIARLTGFPPAFFYQRVPTPAGRTFICAPRKELRAVVEAGEVGSPVCPSCEAVCWLKVRADVGGEVLLEGPDPAGQLIMCVVGRDGRGRDRRLVWGVRRAGRGDRGEPHLLRRAHACSGRPVGRVQDTGLFSRPG